MNAVGERKRFLSGSGSLFPANAYLISCAFADDNRHSDITDGPTYIHGHREDTNSG